MTMFNPRRVLAGLWFAYALSPLYAQFEEAESNTWKVIREEDGVVISSRAQANDLMQFKLATVMQASPEKVYASIQHMDSIILSQAAIKKVEIFDRESDEVMKLYYLANAPFIAQDRDVAYQLNYRATGKGYILSMTAVPDKYPTNPKVIRIETAQLYWNIKRLDNKNTCQVYLWGTIDPGGNVPKDLTNKIMADIPMRLIVEVRRRTEPANAKKKRAKAVAHHRS